MPVTTLLAWRSMRSETLSTVVLWARMPEPVMVPES
jgi:hypothetical protein